MATLLPTKLRFLPRSERALRAAGSVLRRTDLEANDRRSCLIRTAHLAARAGMVPRALAHLREARGLNPDVEDRVKIADLFLDLGKSSECQATLDELPKPRPDEEAPRRARLLQARLHLTFGRWQESLRVADALLESSDQATSADAWLIATASLLCGRCALNLRARTKAQSYLHRSLEVAQTHRIADIEQEVAGLLGQHFLLSGQIGEAIDALTQSLAANDAAPREEIQLPEAPDRVQPAWLALEAIGEAFRKRQVNPETIRLAKRVEHYLRLVQVRARMLGEAAVFEANLPPQLQTIQRVLEANVSLVRKLRRQHQSSPLEPNGVSSDGLERAEHRLASFRLRSSRRYSGFCVLNGIPIVDDGVSPDPGPSSECVFSFFCGLDRTSLLIWRGTELRRVLSLPRRELLAKWVDQVRPVPPAEVEDGMVARESALDLLGRTLLQETIDELAPEESITIVCDGPLEGIEFEALPLPETRGSEPGSTRSTLGERHPVRMGLSHLGVYPTQSPGSEATSLPPPEATVALLIADPDYGDGSLSDTAEIPHSAIPTEEPVLSRDAIWGILPRMKEGSREVNEIAARIDEAVVLTGEQASISRVVELMPSADLIHFCVCGVDDREDATRCALVLSQSDADNDGFFQRGQILAMQLNARLVVLSRTNEGIRSTHREVQSWSFRMSQAFLLAGAHAVLAPYRDLPPTENLEFLSRFYTHYLKSRDPSSALHECRKEEGPARNAPYALFA